MLSKLSPKDRSLLLLIAACLVVIWGLFSLLSNLFFTDSNIIKLFPQQENSSKQRWINVERAYTPKDLENRVILLNFWTYDCASCMHILPQIKQLEKELGNKLTIISIHSGKFSNQKDFNSITKAVLRHDINHAVIDDSDLKIWNSFGIKAWPTLVLIDSKGNIKKTYIGEEQTKNLVDDVKKITQKFRYSLNRDSLPILLEKNKIAKRVLNYPTKIEYTKNFPFKGHNAPAFFIANSGQNNILVVSLSGEIITQIGAGKSGFRDGNFETAEFSMPEGILYDEGKLYIADTGNHAIRVANFKEQTVATIAGTGLKGDVIESSDKDAKDIDLASPTDIEFYPSTKHIAIANAGTNQILQFDLEKSQISVLAGNGNEGIQDGKYPQNSLAQPADLAQYNGKLYFVDSETSALRVLEKDGAVKTLIGHGLFDFGYRNGNKANALMQHPLGLTADDTGVYVVDSFNHAIRKYDVNSGEISTFVGGTKGDSLGSSSNTRFDEPEGIISILDRFYVVDSNNNRVVIISRGKVSSELLDVLPPLILPKEGFLQYLPNLYKADKITVSDQKVTLKINLKKGWKINDLGPSFINLLEMVSDDEANLISTFDWNMIANNELKLPKLDEAKNYMLQGVIYYCENKKNALCYVSSYQQEIKADAGEKNNSINIELIY